MRTPIRVASRSKYRAIRTNGYASKAEAKRGAELEQMERCGLISQLQKQPSFLLVPADKLGRRVYYRADFKYWNPETQDFVVEDVKGFRTPLYQLKRRLMWSIWQIEVQEV